MNIVFYSFADVPNQMPPLTPGTNKKLTEVLKASFASWEKEVQYRNITKGKSKRERGLCCGSDLTRRVLSNSITDK